MFITPKHINITGMGVLAVDVKVNDTQQGWEQACAIKLNAEFLGFINVKEELKVTLGTLCINL